MQENLKQKIDAKITNDLNKIKRVLKQMSNKDESTRLSKNIITSYIKKQFQLKKTITILKNMSSKLDLVDVYIPNFADEKKYIIPNVDPIGFLENATRDDFQLVTEFVFTLMDKRGFIDNYTIEKYNPIKYWQITSILLYLFSSKSKIDLTFLLNPRKLSRDITNISKDPSINIPFRKYTQKSQQRQKTGKKKGKKQQQRGGAIPPSFKNNSESKPKFDNKRNFRYQKQQRDRRQQQQPDRNQRQQQYNIINKISLTMFDRIYFSIKQKGLFISKNISNGEQILLKDYFTEPLQKELQETNKETLLRTILIDTKTKNGESPKIRNLSDACSKYSKIIVEDMMNENIKIRNHINQKLVYSKEEMELYFLKKNYDKYMSAEKMLRDKINFAKSDNDIQNIVTNIRNKNDERCKVQDIFNPLIDKDDIRRYITQYYKTELMTDNYRDEFTYKSIDYLKTVQSNEFKTLIKQILDTLILFYEYCEKQYQKIIIDLAQTFDFPNNEIKKIANEQVKILGLRSPNKSKLNTIKTKTDEIKLNDEGLKLQNAKAKLTKLITQAYEINDIEKRTAELNKLRNVEKRLDNKISQYLKTNNNTL